MIGRYKRYTTCSTDNDIVTRYVKYVICDCKDAVDSEEEYTWDTVDDLVRKYDFSVLDKKKGKVVYVYGYDGEFIWKQWKHDLHIKYKHHYEPCVMSLKQIMDFDDSNMAIKYLKQEGLTVCPMVD